MTMIERVARAIARAEQDPEERYWHDYVDAARAAIEAMREPTGAMWKARLGPHPMTSQDCWSAMIDAALSEAEHGRALHADRRRERRHAGRYGLRDCTPRRSSAPSCAPYRLPVWLSSEDVRAEIVKLAEAGVDKAACWDFNHAVNVLVERARLTPKAEG